MARSFEYQILQQIHIPIDHIKTQLMSGEMMLKFPSLNTTTLYIILTKPGKLRENVELILSGTRSTFL